MGGGGAEFDFKMMDGYLSYTEFGEGYEMYGTGGGWQTHMELVRGMYECDDARMYNGTTHRKMAAPD